MSGNNPKGKGKAPSSHKQLLKGEQMQKQRVKQVKIGKWEQMVAHPDLNAAVRTPSSSPFTGAALPFTRTFELKHSDLGEGVDDFELIVDPHLQNTLQLPAASALVVPDTYEFDGGSDMSVTDVTVAGGGKPLSGPFTLVDSADSKILALIQNSYDASFGPYWEISGLVNTKMEFNMPSGGFLSVAVWLRIAGVWTFQEQWKSGKQLVTPTGNFDGLGISVSNPTSTFGFGPSFSKGTGAGSNPVVSPDRAFDTFETDAISLSRVSRYRVTAMSVLISYAGNMFNNGGVIAAARTRAGYYYDGQPYDSLTKLTDHSYKGTLKDGAYIWWLPYNIEEMDFRGPNEKISSTQLRAAGSFSDPDGTLQITINMVVEFYSPLQIFAHDVGPALTDEFVRAYHKMDTVPAACCNPSHTELLKSLLKSGKNVAGKAAKKGILLAIENPAVVAALLAGAL
jgi:hypothetical protein